MTPVFSALGTQKKEAASVGKDVAKAFIVTDAKKLSASASALDKIAGGLIKKAIATSKFEGKSGQVLHFVAPAGCGADHILVAGLGKAKDITTLSYESVGGGLVQKANALGVKTLEVRVDGAEGKKIDAGEAEAHIGLGAALKSYRFDKYFTKEEKKDKPTLAKVKIFTSDAAKAKKAYVPLDALYQGSVLTRNVVTEPGNIIHPESLAKVCKELSKDGLKVEVLGEKEMKKLGMGSLLSVGDGSQRESQLVVMQWNGGAKKDKPLAFVGKGVTFDTGGISIKPSGGMEEMKWDMGGSGTVIGLMKTLALRKAKVNAIGVVGLVENMPDGKATRPGDVVTSMSGQTIEVLNTDAEGRLVLADALWYTQDRFKPEFMIDLATLTGAIIVSLGHEHAGLFSNNDKLSERLLKLADKTGEKTWRFPLTDGYNKQIDSPIADMQNIGNARGAGSITAAQFLQRFVNDTPWVHLDIAGTAWTKEDKPTCAKGATAFGVKLLNELVAEHYEK